MKKVGGENIIYRIINEICTVLKVLYMIKVLALMIVFIITDQMP